jgi:hypothetical protein
MGPICGSLDEMGYTMQLFSRRVVLAGPPSEMLAYATDIRSHVSEVSGRELALWSVGFGAPLGTMMFAMRVEGVADFQEVSARVLADQEYHAKLAAGTAFIGGPSEDSLLQPLNIELPEDHPPVGSVAALTSAVMANGSYEAAIGWGLDMAEHATKVTGIQTMFAMPQYGPFGAVTWIGVSENAAGADAANAALNGDADYIKKLGAAGELFVEGSGMRVLATRIA